MLTRCASKRCADVRAARGGAEGGGDETLTYAEVKERLNLPDEDVTRLLHSLSCAKYKILLKEPGGKTIAKGDAFRINARFTDRQRRIKARPAAQRVSVAQGPGPACPRPRS